MRRIFLVGPMGAGKTAIGRELARQLKLEFLDADHEIERRTGADVALIFEKEGEGAVLPVAPAAIVVSGAQAARATGGRAMQAPIAAAARESQGPASLGPMAPVPAPTGRRKNES